MHVVTWRFRVKPEHISEFKEAYGPAGAWAKLFGRAHGFVKTDLLPHQASPVEFTTVDYWRSKNDYERFKAAYQQEYDRLDRQFGALTTREERIDRLGD
jgi:heme-degrading monooxygenase HmoA